MYLLRMAAAKETNERTRWKYLSNLTFTCGRSHLTVEALMKREEIGHVLFFIAQIFTVSPVLIVFLGPTGAGSPRT